MGCSGGDDCSLGSSMSVTSEGAKSASLNTSGLKGKIPVEEKPEIAIGMVALFRMPQQTMKRCRKL